MLFARVHGRIHICILDHLCILGDDVLLARLGIERSHNVAAGADYIGIHIVGVPGSEGIRFPHVFAATLAVPQIHVPSVQHGPELLGIIPRVAECIRALEYVVGHAAVHHQAVRMKVGWRVIVTEPLGAGGLYQGLAQVLVPALAILMIANSVISEWRQWGLLLNAPVDGERDVGKAAHFQVLGGRVGPAAQRCWDSFHFN